jgi:PmbA protein
MNDETSEVLIPREFWHQLVAELLEKARQKGATQAEVSAGLNYGFNLNVRNGQVETVEYHRSRHLGVTVYFEHCKGTATTSDILPDSLDKTLDAACYIAGVSGKDDFSGLAEKKFLAYDYPNLSLCHPWNIQVEEGIDLARRCESLAFAQDKRIKSSEGAYLSTHQALSVYGNTHGFLGEVEATSHSMSCHLLVQSEQGMERDYDYSVARDAADLDSVEKIAQHAVQRTLRRMNPRRLTTRQVPVLFDATVASALIGSLIGAISGGSQYQKASFLLNALGEMIFPPFIHIYERPHLQKGIASAPFDSDGVKTINRDFVRDGVLQSYVLSAYSARKLGLTPTGNAGGIHNLFVEPGTDDQKAMLKRLGTGFLVTEMMGQGVNLITGDYSRGASGFWVENGEIQYPVHEVTIAGNLKTMFRNIVAVGNDVDHRRNIRTGSILVEEMMVGGV